MVTGGAGFIGSNLVDALLARGDEVTVIDDLSTGRRENLAAALEAGAQLVELDVRDPEGLNAATERAAPEVVFHLAAQIDVRRSVADPEFDAAVNVGGTANAIEAARRAGTRRFVFVSTGGAIYGEGEGHGLPFDESTEARPLSPYGKNKLAAEGEVELCSRDDGLSGISLRLANVYGPRQDPLGEGGVIAIFCGRLRAGARPTIYGDGRQTRDFVYVGDVVDALLAAAGSEVVGAFNIGTGIETDLLELVEILRGTDDGGDFEPDLADPMPGDVRRNSIDASRARSELGWRASTSLEDGIRRTLESL
jgi:UDP-glucose 4-epimerase